MADTHKSVVGLRDLYYALVTQDDASAYAAGTPAYLAPAMTASQAPATNSKTQYADDGPFDVMASEGETKIDLEVTNIPLDVVAAILGKEYDAVNDVLYDNGGTPPDVALSFRSKKSNGSYKYYQYLKGKFSAPSEEQASDTDTPDPKPMKITFTAVKTTYAFDLGSINDGVKRLVADEDTTSITVANWFTTVQVPGAGSASALTCTPSPADAATGVAVSVSPTLTFNNALQTGVTGITIVSAAGAIPASAYSIDATNKIITINPDSNLGAATKYIITVAGARDIYGQTLALTAYDFTTA